MTRTTPRKIGRKPEAEKTVSDFERYLAAKGKSPAWLAAQFKVSRAAVSGWLSGDKHPKRSRIPKLAALLGVDELTMTYLIWPDRKGPSERNVNQ